MAGGAVPGLVRVGGMPHAGRGCRAGAFGARDGGGGSGSRHGGGGRGQRVQCQRGGGRKVAAG